MPPASSFAASLNPATPPDAVARAELSEIDASARWPTVIFLLSALIWLLVGTVFALIASFKLHTATTNG
jgi:cytochrome c oxidase cbb3-type subunit 1